MRAAICAKNPPIIDADDFQAAHMCASTATSTAQNEPDFQNLWQALLPYFQAGVGLDTLVSQIESQAVTEADGNISAAARLLGLSRAKLDYRRNK